MKLSAKLQFFQHQGRLSSASGSSRCCGCLSAHSAPLPPCGHPVPAAGAMVHGVLGCAATLCPGTPPGTAVLQEQDFWTAGGRGPQEGGCRSPAEQPGPVGALCPSVGLGRDIYLLLSEDLGVEGHFGGLVLLTEESVTS